MKYLDGSAQQLLFMLYTNVVLFKHFKFIILYLIIQHIHTQVHTYSTYIHIVEKHF